MFLSTAGLEKPCRNPPGPLGKAKYYSLTDSELVPWGKGEKNPDEGSEIESETMCLQAAGAEHIFIYAEWRRTFCIMGRRVTECSQVKEYSSVAVAKASPNRAI
jgi:hypothetical protein